MGIGECDDIPGAGIDLPVAPERVLPLVLRATVNVQDEGIFPAGIEAVWFYDEHLHLGLAAPLDPHGVSRANVHLAYEGFVGVCELNLAGRAASCHRGTAGLGRIGDGAPHVDESLLIAGECKFVDGALRKDCLDPFACDVEPAHRIPALVWT